MTARLWRGALSLVGLVAVTAGLPWALVVHVGWPLPHHVPTQAQWQAWLARPLTLSTLISAAACAVWLSWAWTMYALLRAVIARRRRVRAPRPRLAASLHTVASNVVGSLILTAAETSRAATGLPSTPPAAAPVSNPTPADAAIPATATIPDEGPGTSVPTGGVAVPGGWLPAQTAQAILAAAAWTWMTRRVRYRPRPPSGADRTDADLTPLPATIAGIRRAIFTPADVDGSAVAPSPVEVEAATAAHRRSAVGTVDDRPLYAVDLPAAGVGLVGPGAVDAARAVLVAALVDSRSAAQVHTTSADLETLFGTADPTNGLSRVRVHAGVDAALAAVLPHPPTAGTRARPASPSAHPVLLLIEAPDQALVAGLADLLAPADSRIIAVVLGAWPRGATWHVRADGTIRTGADDAARVRLAVLDRRAATEVITTLAQTAGDGKHTAAKPPTPRPPQSTPPGSRTQPPLTLRTLGRPALIRTGPYGEHEVSIRRSAGLHILIYLAIHRDGASSADIKEAVWPDVPSGAAAGRYHTTISELRKTLDAAARATVIRQGPVTDPTEIGKMRLWLDPDRIHVDLWALHDRLDAAATAVDATVRTDLLHTVIASYTGELAYGLHYQWIHPVREATRRHLIDTYTHLTRQEPDHPTALQLLQEAIRHAPDTEALYQIAIARHLAAGDHASAAATLNTLLDRLHDLGVQPDGHTLRLAADLLTTTSPPATPR